MHPSFWKLLLCSLHLCPLALPAGDSVGFLPPLGELVWSPLTTWGLGELLLSPSLSRPFCLLYQLWGHGNRFSGVHCPLHSAGNGAPWLLSACQVLLIGGYRRSRAKGRRLVQVSLLRWALTYFSEYTPFPVL